MPNYYVSIPFNNPSIIHNGEIWFRGARHEMNEGTVEEIYYSPSTPTEFITLKFTIENKKRYNLPEHLFHIEE